MFRGVAIVIAACFIWGLIYVIPGFMPAFNPLEVSLGRYVCYGIVSVFYMLFFRRQALFKLKKKHWKQAFLFGFLANVGCYPAIVISMRYANPAIAALILGMSPISIAFYGNWKQRQCSYIDLLWPCLAMGIGLILANIPALEQSALEGSLFYYSIGLLFAFYALGTWTVYAVANGRLLQEDGSLDPCDWCSVIGIATLAWVAFFVSIAFFFVPEHQFNKFIIWTPELQVFLTGSLVLGSLCSWFAFYLWNKGSCLLPVSFAGQLTIFETMFGLIFVYLVEQRMPIAIEFAGIAIIIGGIYASIHLFKDVPEVVRAPVVVEENNSQ